MDALRLTLRQLQIFAAVAHSGSTMAASEKISLSQSATSAAVNELERLLSQRLFDRAGKRLVLNENGRALLPHALAMLDSATAIEHMSRSSAAQASSLRIGASTTIGNYVLPKLLGQFLRECALESMAGRHAKVTIGNTEAICAAVAAFELDIGLIEGPCHEADLDVTPWMQDELVLVCASTSGATTSASATGLPQRGSGKVSLEALRAQLWLLREPGSGTRQATDQLLLPHLRSYQRSIELGSSEAIKYAAEEGLGIACLSRWVVNDLLQSGRLQTLETALPMLKRQSYLVVHRHKWPSPALQRFMTLATSAPETSNSAGTVR